MDWQAERYADAAFAAGQADKRAGGNPAHKDDPDYMFGYNSAQEAE